MQHFFVDASQVSEETIRIEGSDVNEKCAPYADW